MNYTGILMYFGILFNLSRLGRKKKSGVKRLALPPRALRTAALWSKSCGFGWGYMVRVRGAYKPIIYK